MSLLELLCKVDRFSYAEDERPFLQLVVKQMLQIRSTEMHTRSMRLRLPIGGSSVSSVIDCEILVVWIAR